MKRMIWLAGTASAVALAVGVVLAQAPAPSPQPYSVGNRVGLPMAAGRGRHVQPGLGQREDVRRDLLGRELLVRRRRAA